MELITIAPFAVRITSLKQPFLYIYTMAKEVKKKAPKEASNLFHSIMAASVKGNPKPKKKNAKKKA